MNPIPNLKIFHTHGHLMETTCRARFQSPCYKVTFIGGGHRYRHIISAHWIVLLFIDLHCAGVSNKQCLLTFLILPDFLSSELW